MTYFKNVVLIILLSLNISALAANFVPGPSLPSFTPNSNPVIQSCYRWMSTWELSRWKNSGPQFETLINDWLERDGNGKAIYCWKNSIGGFHGGLVEEYGNHLVRIDFKSDAVFYDRNTKKYFSLKSSTDVPLQKKNELSSEIVFELIYFDANPFFQEYMVRSNDPILSWTSNDPQLKETLIREYNLLQQNKLNYWDYHFFYWYYDQSNKYSQRFPESGRPYYLKIADEKVKNMQKYWSETSHENSN